MPDISKDQLRERLRQYDFAPVYVLHGSETYLRDIAARTISERAFQAGDMRDFNEDEFSLSVPGALRTALAAAEQMPMLATRRVVRITDVRVAAVSQRDTLKEADEMVLRAYLENPEEHTIVVFIADELNKNRKLGRLLRTKAAAVEFEMLSEPKLLTWAAERFEKYETEVETVALRHLITLVGPDLSRLENEIAKLATAALPERKVDVPLIDRLVSRSRETTNFELIEHLIAGRHEHALDTLKRILDDGAEPVALIGLLAYNFRQLLIAKEMLASGAGPGDVSRGVSLRPGTNEGFFTAVRRSNTGFLRRMVKRLADTDLALKTSVGGGGPAGSRLQLEVLMCELSGL